MAEDPRREAGNNKANEAAVAGANLRSTADNSNLCVDGSGVIAHAKPAAREDNPDDLDATAEFPVLVVDDAVFASDESEEAEEQKMGPTRVEQRSPTERASICLQNPESDIQRLQAKWESVAADLRVREAKVQELCGRVEARDALVGDLHRQIGEQATAQLALKTDVGQASARIADLVAAQVAREISVAIAQAQFDLQEAWEAIAIAVANRAAPEKARLSDTVDPYAEAGAQRRYEDKGKLATNLRATVEELETYINDSKERWSALCEKLAEYRDAHRASERRVPDVRARFMPEAMSRHRLWTEAADLERRLKEVGAQFAERESEHRELERRLNEERAAAKQLRGDVVSAAAHGYHALDELRARDQRVADLELLVMARDETIAGLKRRLQARDRTEGELLAMKNDVEAHAAAPSWKCVSPSKIAPRRSATGAMPSRRSRGSMGCYAKPVMKSTNSLQ